jgi:tRNA pseudouridine38-40 synthase
VSQPHPPDASAAPVRVRLDVAYDGTDFHGWAVQPGLRTVAGEVRGALARLLGPDGATGLTVAGRTDAGVHATGQVCHVDVAPAAWERMGASLLRRLAGVLPPDVRVTGVTPVDPAFDARFSARARRYVYRVSDAPHGANPLHRHHTVAWPRPLDLAALDASATGLVGEHDFAAFCRRKPDGTTIRTVTELNWQRGRDGVLVASVTADAFCQAMVRSLVGAMLAVGEGQRSHDWPSLLLRHRERSGEVRVAPPHGLTLVAVDYPATPEGWAARTYETRRRRQAPAGSTRPSGAARPPGDR